MNIADAFPESYRQDFANRNIDIGSAILIKMPDFDVNYNKYVIYLSDSIIDDTKCGIIVINTKINENINFSSYLMSQHILIDVLRHDFLEEDSYIDCTQIHQKDIQEIIDHISNNPKNLCGNVQEDIMAKVKALLVNSRVLSNNDKRKYKLIK